ncbi:metal-transporting ATPase [Geomonas limicola]|uniref:Metal-transporting ATPase n=1 Tax=Geomonas limicola TaxID=2740186 RepID=A0A6V8N8J4_9BACT|nr:cation-translocating P-type ATPase [Geomonas limicola]GFO67639.1 metal-transporting ATPase [Geomonas limicola]
MHPTTSTLTATCAHCGLPVPSRLARGAAALYCCSACRLVARIIGTERGEQNGHLLRLGLGSLLAMNVMMVSLLLYTDSVAPHLVPTFRLILFCLATPALAVLLPPFLAGAQRELASHRMSLDALIALGSLSAYGVSAFTTLKGSGEVYFDTATMLPVLVTAGKLLESTAKAKASDLLTGMLSLLPTSALRVSCSSVCEVSIAELQPGDLIRIRPGERVAVDGRIMEGMSTLEEAAFTGEFLPRVCRPGDSVIAGTVNGIGTLLVQAERTGDDLLLRGIVSLIQEAWSQPSRAQRLAERSAGWFTPVILGIAFATFFGWHLAGYSSRGLLSALSVLVVACPCTVGIATPLATALAMARAARAGIVVRGGAVLERLAAVNLFFFDKTGTLTTGQPVLREVRVLSGEVDEGEILARVAGLETASEHLLARALVREARGRQLPPAVASFVEVVPGCGLSGLTTYQQIVKQVTVGSPGFLVPGAEVAGDASLPDAASVVDVAFDALLVARLVLQDALRPEAVACLAGLQTLGIPVALLSGDRAPAATAAAAELGISRVEAPCTPHQKIAALAKEAASGRVVAMVGDGINDAPALAAADVGIAFGSGTDLARLAGKVVMLSDRLDQVPWLVHLSRATGRIVRQNLGWSFLYNTLAVAAAVAGALHPLLAAVAMVLSSLTVLGNSLRISRFPDRVDQTATVQPQLVSPAQPLVSPAS